MMVINFKFSAAFACCLENNLETAASSSCNELHHFHITITWSVKWYRPVFLELGAAKGCRGFQEMKIHNGRRVFWQSKFVRTSVNERSFLIMVFSSLILEKILFSKHDVYHFEYLIQ